MEWNSERITCPPKWVAFKVDFLQQGLWFDHSRLRLCFHWPTARLLFLWAYYFGNGLRSSYRWDMTTCLRRICSRPIFQYTSCQLHWRHKCLARVFCRLTNSHCRCLYLGKWTSLHLLSYHCSIGHNISSYQHTLISQFHSLDYSWTIQCKYPRWSRCTFLFRF